ncbi:hypothetical protein EE612_004482 [Oryza sativa]|nr:hypothetical protein EE612_004482 [Oryza sativa]
MEGRVEDPPVLGPLLSLVVGHAVGEQLRQHGELELLEVAHLVGQHVLGYLGVGDGHLGDGAEPGEARLAVLRDGPVHERRHARRDVVAPQRQRPRPCLLAQPAVVLEVAGEEAVGRATDALRPQRPLQPPRLPPQPHQQPVDLPQKREPQETVHHGAPWHRGRIHDQHPRK